MSYLFLLEYCLRMSLIFLAWVREPPGDEMVTTNACGLTQNAFLRPVVTESVLFGLNMRLQFLVYVSLYSYSQNS